MARNNKITIVTEPAINDLNERYGTFYSLQNEDGHPLLLDHQIINKTFITFECTLDYEEIKYYFNKAVCELQTGQKIMETSFVPKVLYSLENLN